MESQKQEVGKTTLPACVATSKPTSKIVTTAGIDPMTIPVGGG
jgi:hypothetical protein